VPEILPGVPEILPGVPEILPGVPEIHSSILKTVSRAPERSSGAQAV
jgi:hypothetical protein